MPERLVEIHAVLGENVWIAENRVEFLVRKVLGHYAVALRRLLHWQIAPHLHAEMHEVDPFEIIVFAHCDSYNL